MVAEQTNGNTGIGAAVRLLRPREWVKNAFVAAPLVFSKSFTEPSAIWQTAFAVAVFCGAASAVYVFNDLRDVRADREHPTKRYKRPIAAGQISVASARIILALLIAAVGGALSIRPGIAPPIIAYLALNVAYSIKLKHVPVVDLFVIAIGFVLRVDVGAKALDVPLSMWMFITTISLSLFLASIKRKKELATSGADSRALLAQYSPELMDRYAITAAVGSIVFYSLYVVSEAPELAITIPLVLFGIFRYWFIVDATEEAGETPSAALLQDPQLLLTVAAWTATCAWVLTRTGH